MFAAWEDIDAFLTGKGLFHVDLSLGRMRSGLTVTGKPVCHLIQVLGTNGKGSTSVFLASLAQAHGLKTGLYMSPHFVSAKERVLINGKQISDTEWLDAANELGSRAPDLLPQLTYFEFLTLIAVIIFRNEQTDIAIFEAGLGGAHDATTAINAKTHCYAPIAMDHAAVLGPTLAAIAQDKAAAITPASRVFSSRQYPDALNILREETTRKKASLAIAGPLPTDSSLGLGGQTQLANAGLALQCWRAIASDCGVKSKIELETLGLRKAFIPGRLQIIDSIGASSPILLDGAHNPHAMQSLVRQLPFTPSAIIFSALRDKNWQAGLGILLSSLPNSKLFIPQLDNERAENAHTLAAWSEKTHFMRASVFEGPGSFYSALKSARGSVLICGSLYLLAEFYKLYPQYLEPEKD